MTEKQLFGRFPRLADCDPGRKEQLIHYLTPAPEGLLEHFAVEEIPGDTVFVREGSPASWVYLLARGSLNAVDYRVCGVEYEFMQFAKIYALGAMEILMERKDYCTTLKTQGPCLMIRIPRESFESWLMSDIQTLRYESKLMGEHLLEEGRRSRIDMFLPGPERLAKILIRQYETRSVKGVLSTRGNRQDLANATGFNIKTVTRAIKSLEDAGLITRKERSITVNEEQYRRLKEFVDNMVASEEE